MPGAGLPPGEGEEDAAHVERSGRCLPRFGVQRREPLLLRIEGSGVERPSHTSSVACARSGGPASLRPVDTYTALVMPEAGALPAPETRPVPEPTEDEAVVRVRASSMNFHDLANLLGLIDGPWPRVPMADGAGEIVAVGRKARGLEVGDHVTGAFLPRWSHGPPGPRVERYVPGDSGDGWLQQYVRFPARALVPTPEHLSDREAATLPCAGVTAWSALRVASIKAGDVVVCLGTGGVSLLALQLAKAHGATVVLTSSSDDKLRRGAELGADHLVNYRRDPQWDEAVRDVTHGRGADLVIDVGGEDTVARSVRSVRRGGTVAVIGALGGAGQAEVSIFDVMGGNVHLVGITVGSVTDHRDLCRAVAAHGIHPPISHTLSWHDVAEAMRVMQSHEHVGKIVLEVS